MKHAIFLIILFLFNNSIFAQNLEFKGYNISKQVKATSVKNQSESPTCWSFATISFIESELLRKGFGQFDLSEMYIVYNVYIRKAIQHYRMKGNDFFKGGGQSHNVMLTIEKNGIVPESIYSGLHYRQNYHNHTLLNFETKSYITKLLDVNDTLPDLWKEGFVSILDKYLTTIPKSFTYKNNKYSPKLFADSVLRLNMQDYVDITSYTHHPFYTKFCLESYFNWEQQLYYNVPLNEFIEIINNAIYNGYSICWNGDVSESTFDIYNGVADLKVQGSINQEMRQKLFDNHSTKVDHVMHLIGIAKNKDNNTSYLIKNSWGTEYNKGYLFMSDSYLKLKTVSIMVHKDAIPTDIRKKMIGL